MFGIKLFGTRFFTTYLSACGDGEYFSPFAGDKSQKLVIILRVPILYGPVEYVGEGAVDALLPNLLKGGTVSLDNRQIRYPTHVEDVADAVALLIQTATQVWLVLNVTCCEPLSILHSYSTIFFFKWNLFQKQVCSKGS